MLNKIKKWIFSKLCFGSEENPVTDSFPCDYCKYYKHEKCRLYNILRVKE